ncbi:MAG: TolC family protein [Endomicrobia bacterium]|nr:TolC family protein [Endomicrobiia bacterium]MCL2506597.1 TolC family protein [Endomicrobiia bacterium]
MKKTIFAVAILFLTSFAFAEKINWEIVVQQTLEKNPLIQSAKLRLENAQQAYNRSLSGYMPMVSLRGSASQRGGDAADGINTTFSRSYSYGLSANLSIFSGFDTYNDVRQKSTELKIAQLSYDRVVSDVAYEVTSQYINLMWAYESVELSKRIFERRKENRDMVQLKYNSGNVDAGSLKRIEADVELTSFNLRKAQRYIETASAALLKAIGRKDNVILVTEEKLSIHERMIARPDFADIITKIPEFLTAQFNVDVSRFQYAKVKSAWFPNIGLSGGMSRAGREWAPDRDSWDAGLSISYMLFNGGARFADTKISSNQLKITEETFKNVTNSLRSSVVSYFNSLTDSIENMSVREFYLAASQLQAEISMRKYINGLSSYQDWYSIENDYINSQTMFLDTKRSSAMEKSRWRNFLGEGFADEPGK